MTNNGKRPRDEPGRNIANIRSYGLPLNRRHQRLPSQEDQELSDGYEYGSSSDEDDGGWTTTTTGSESRSSADTDFYDEEEEMMLLDEFYEEVEEMEEEEEDAETDLIGFSSDEGTSYDEAMDRELARVEREMNRKEQRKNLMVPDGIDTDDEDAWRYLEDEWINEQEQQSAALPEPDWDDAVNRRFLLRGNVAGKPCTMTSVVGSLRARISMAGTIIPAVEMLRNYFRDCRKENAVGREVVMEESSPKVVRSNGVTCQRKALSERNL